MVYSSYSIPSTQGRVVPAALGLFVSACLSVLHLNIAGQAVTLTWLPLLALLLWPSSILPILSVVCFLIVGLFVDWSSGGAPGQWALIYLTCLVVLSPANRKSELLLTGVIRNWVMIVMISVLIFTLSGWFVYSRLPVFSIMARQAMLVTAILPFYYLTRFVTRALLGNPTERD